jgi:hypothetical protein
MIIEDYDNNGSLINTRNTSSSDFAYISSNFTFKDMKAFTITFNPVITTENGISILKNADSHSRLTVLSTSLLRSLKPTLPFIRL